MFAVFLFPTSFTLSIPVILPAGRQRCADHVDKTARCCSPSQAGYHAIAQARNGMDLFAVILFLIFVTLFIPVALPTGRHTMC